MLNEDERNRLRVLSVQQNVPLRISSPTPQPQVNINQPTVRQQPQVRVTSPYIPPTPQPRTPSRLEEAQSFISGAGSQLGGGLLRAGLRTVPTIARFTPIGAASFVAGRLGGRDIGAEFQKRGEELAKQSEQLQAKEIAQQPSQRMAQAGMRFGSAIKGTADVASLILPAAAASRAAQATQLYRTGIAGGRALNLGTRIAENIVSGLPSTAVSIAQEIGRGKQPNLAREALVGVLADAVVPVLGKGVQALRSSGVKALFTRVKEPSVIKEIVRNVDNTLPENVVDDAAEALAKSSNIEQVDRVVEDLIEQTPVPTGALVPEVPSVAPAVTGAAIQAVENTVQQLARTSDVNAVREAIQALYPQLDEASQTNFARTIAATNNPTAVKQTLDQAQARSEALSQTIRQVTPEAPSPVQRQAEAAAQFVQEQPVRVETPTPVTRTVETPTPTAVQGAVGPQGIAKTTLLPKYNNIEDFIKIKKIDPDSVWIIDSANMIVENTNGNNALLTELPINVFGKPNFETLNQRKYTPGRKITDPIEATISNGRIVITDGANRFTQAVANNDSTIPVIVDVEVGGKPIKAESIRSAVEEWLSQNSLSKNITTTEAQLSTPTAVQGATFNAVDTKVPVPAEVTNYETLGGQFQRAFVEKDAPIINYAKQLEKQTGETGLVDQIYYVTGLQRRANAIANAEINTNANLRQALEGLDSTTKGEFDIYVAARNELSNASRGLPTSRPVDELQELVDRLTPEYGDRFTALNAYYQDWALKMRNAGLISEDTYQTFISNPDYTRIQRVMDDLATPPTRGGASYSFGTPSARQRRKGSLREIQPADITAFDYAQRIQKEIQRNQTASTLIDLLQLDDAARQIPASQAARKNVIKRVVDGQTQYWEVPRDIKELADNVTPYQLGVLQQIIALPQRVLRAGISGLSAPFTAVNFARDIVSSAVFSKNAKATHLNPLNILNGLKNASADTLGANLDNELWNKFISIAGDTTSFDFLRNVSNAQEVSRKLRLGKLGQARNMAGSPIRTLEDLNTITERATRFSNFKGVYESVLKQTNDPNLALREATLAAWQNSVDFSRMGNVSQVINLLIPYFNASIQGTRLLGRRLVENPVATSGKILGLIGMPLMGATLYNVSDPKRKAIYDNISEYEKENNTIIVLPNAQQNEDGSYSGVIKIPLQPGLSNLVNPIRQVTELYAGQVPLPEAQKMLSQFMQAFSGPLDFGSVNGMLSSLTPQVIKPVLQQVMNKDLFTGREIVPEYIEQQVTATGEPIKESDKAYRYSSGTARFVGNRLGVSPIRVEKFIKDTTGKVGQYVINASDNILSKAGVIPNEQIGGLSVKDDFTRRFVEASAKYNYKKSEGAQFYDVVKEATKGLSPNEKKAYDALHPQKTNILGEDIFDENKRIMKYARAGVYLQFPDVFEAERAIEMEQRKRGNPANPLYDLPADQLTKVLLKAALPPGAKDPELSNLWQEEWYQDFNAKRDAYYTQLQAKLASQGKSFPPQENPYPTTPPELQQVMNFYSSLPKGTGQRSAWIRSNPTLWNQMTNQWAAVDAWENKERAEIGLSPVESFVQNAQQSGVRFGGTGSTGGTSAEYKAIMATLKELGITVKPLEIISAAPRRNVRLARVRVPTTRRTRRIQLR